MNKPTDQLDPEAFAAWTHAEADRRGKLAAAVSALFEAHGDEDVFRAVDVELETRGLLNVRELHRHSTRVAGRGAILPVEAGHASMGMLEHLAGIRNDINSIEHDRRAEAAVRDEAVEQLRAKRVA